MGGFATANMFIADYTHTSAPELSRALTSSREIHLLTSRRLNHPAREKQLGVWINSRAKQMQSLDDWANETGRGKQKQWARDFTNTRHQLTRGKCFAGKAHELAHGRYWCWECCVVRISRVVKGTGKSVQWILFKIIINNKLFLSIQNFNNRLNKAYISDCTHNFNSKILGLTLYGLMDDMWLTIKIKKTNL